MIQDELKARARFAVGDVVQYRAGPWRVTARYWRPSTDLILYDIREIIGNAPTRALFRRKVAEGELYAPPEYARRYAKD